MVQQGPPSARLVRRLVYITSSSPDPGRDTGYMVHPLGGILEVDKWVTQPAQDRFLVVQARRTRFLTTTSLRNDIANAAGYVLPRRRYVESCMKVICGLEDLAYVSP
jgi:hypothetical protein